MNDDLLYLRTSGGFSVAAWEHAIASTPNTRVVLLTENELPRAQRAAGPTASKSPAIELVSR